MSLPAHLLPPQGDALLRAFCQDPRPGLLLTGESLLKERLLSHLVQTMRMGWPVLLLPRHAALAGLYERPDPLSALEGGLLRQPGLLARAEAGLLVIPAADLLEPEVAVAAARAPRILATAGDLTALHPALRERLTAIFSLVPVEGALPALLHPAPAAAAPVPPAGPAPLAGPAAPPDPEELVARFAAWGVSGHALEYHAYLLAQALAATGTSVPDALDRFVLAPRSQQPQPQPQPQPPAAPEAPAPAPGSGEPAGAPSGTGQEQIEPPEPPARVEPPRRPSQPEQRRSRHPSEGRGGPVAPDQVRGRIYRTESGCRKGTLALFATLQRAAPWQRRRGGLPADRVKLRPEDLRWARRRRRSGRMTLLVVDGSGSMARRSIRLAKGIAISLLQAAYQNRDRVAIILVQGAAARVALWPTRSIVRAQGCLRALPTGGGTPLASGLLLAGRLASQRDPATVSAVLLTDGRANIGLGGDPRADALRALDLLRQRTAAVHLIDLAPRYAAGRGAAWLAERLGPVPVRAP